MPLNKLLMAMLYGNVVLNLQKEKPVLAIKFQVCPVIYTQVPFLTILKLILKIENILFPYVHT